MISELALATPHDPAPVPAPDTCSDCGGLIVSNAQWDNDELPYCPRCAMVLEVAGRRLHGARTQARFWNAADQIRPGLRAEDWLIEEFQVFIGGHRYRADFVIRWLPSIQIAIEIDSFTHHSSSAAIARDRKRQRMFQRDGWLVIRFAGGEVWNDAKNCIEELIEIVTSYLTGSQAQSYAA